MPESTPFADLTAYNAIPRIEALVASPDGSRLVVTLATPDADAAAFERSLWALDPAGLAPARRLTRAQRGDPDPRIARDGTLLLRRPEEPAAPASSASGSGARGAATEPPIALWALPAGGGEAREVARHPGGVAAYALARDSADLVVAADTIPGAVDVSGDAQVRQARRERGVRAILHDASPVRFWDHDLGPGQLRLWRVDPPDDSSSTDPGRLSDLTPDVGRALDEQHFELSGDGRTIVTGWALSDEPGLPRGTIVAIDVASGQRRVLAGDPGSSYSDPLVSPDGRWVVCDRELDGTYDRPVDHELTLLDLAGGPPRRLEVDLPGWAHPAAWAPDSQAIYVLADAGGHRPVYRIDLDPGTSPVRLSASGAYSHVCPADDGRTLYALRSAIDSPPRPVRLDAREGDQEPVVLPAPGALVVPGTLTEVRTRAADGVELRGWLVLPPGARPAEPAPLLLWIHGGPLSSWNSWSWRWNPWLMAARGYAVLLGDPALSTGYGQAFIARGWGRWGDAPYTDLMSLTDAAAARADVDAERTAAMGGSFGGYMANWIAGHTSRFSAIVTHASLWALEAFTGTTDLPGYWVREWGHADSRPERYREFSPERFADAISTPMLVIHGDRDYRVPVGEGLRLWWDLRRRGVESKFLYFPNANHWVLNPGDAQVWYETVFAFLATYVLKAPWVRPELL